MADTVTRDRRASDNVRRDIEETRSRMDETVDALADRLSPDHLLDEAWGRLRGQGDEGIGQVVKEHPIPVALVGVGLGWLAVEQATDKDRGNGGFERDLPTGRTERPITYAGGAQHAEGAERTYHAGEAGGFMAEVSEHEDGTDRGVGERISDAASAVKEKVTSATGSARERASGAMDSARESAKETTDRARERVSHAGGSFEERVRQRGGQAKRGFWSMLEENPLALGAVAFGIGLASGVSVPSSRIEDRTIGRTSETLKEEAKRVGERTAEKAKHVAREAAATAMDESERVAQSTKEAARRSAEQEGLTAEGMKREADTVRQRTTEPARKDAERMKEEKKRQ